MLFSVYNMIAQHCPTRVTAQEHLFFQVHMICSQSSVDLKVSRGGAVLPASQGLNDSRATQRARSLPVEPQTQALLAEHVLQRNIMYTHIFTTEKKKMHS